MAEINPSRDSWLRRRWLIITIIALAICGGWWLWDGRQTAKKTVAPVLADKRILAEGIVFPVQYAQMVMPVDGMVGEVLVKEGETVKTGQPLIRLVRQDYQARVGSSRSDLARAAATLEQARVNLADAERELERQQSLATVGATPKQLVDQAKTAVERNKAALAQAEADLMTQRARLIEAEGVLDKTELRSPIDGKVAFLDIKPGEHATVGTVLVRVANESAWEVRSDDLTELAVAKIRIGDVATLAFDGVPGLEIPARVKFIRYYGEKKRGDMTYTVTLSPERWDERLRWNMTAQIAIEPKHE